MAEASKKTLSEQARKRRRAEPGTTLLRVLARECWAGNQRPARLTVSIAGLPFSVLQVNNSKKSFWTIVSKKKNYVCYVNYFLHVEKDFCIAILFKYEQKC